MQNDFLVNSAINQKNEKKERRQLYLGTGMKNVDRFRMKRLRDSSLPGFDTFTRNQMEHFYLNHHSIIINVLFDHVPMSHDISNLCPTKYMVFV